MNDFTTDDILGKEVIDSSGSFLGVVDKVFVDKSTIEITGLSIDKGFLKTGLHIGKDTIKEIREHAIFLKIAPSVTLKGMKVFDQDGRIIGMVRQVITLPKKNTIQELVIKAGLTQTISIPANYIKLIGDNVLLNVKKSDIRGKISSLFKKSS